jgi:capsular polysaccharide export protein
VVCYGCPFYAGWGLTRDVLQAFPRRNRPLTLDELVAGALILYPTYVSRRTGRLTTPEQALDELLDWRKQIGGSVPLWRKAMRVVLRCVVGAV